jgi:hypothetical protein
MAQTRELDKAVKYVEVLIEEHSGNPDPRDLSSIVLQEVLDYLNQLKVGAI